MNLFIAMNISGLTLKRVAKGALPFTLLLPCLVLFFIFFPNVITFLTNVLGMY